MHTQAGKKSVLPIVASLKGTNRRRPWALTDETNEQKNSVKRKIDLKNKQTGGRNGTQKQNIFQGSASASL